MYMVRGEARHRLTTYVALLPELPSFASPNGQISCDICLYEVLTHSVRCSRQSNIQYHFRDRPMIEAVFREPCSSPCMSTARGFKESSTSHFIMSLILAGRPVWMNTEHQMLL